MLSPPDPRALLARLGDASALPAANEQEDYKFSDDWRWLAYTDGASEVRLYDLKGRSPATPVKVINAAYKNVRIEGRWLLLIAADDSQKYLDLQTFGPDSEPFALPAMAARDTMSEGAIEKETSLYSPDGRWLAHFDGEKKVRMYDLAAKPAPKLFPLSEVEDKGNQSAISLEWNKTTYMTFSPGGHWFHLRTAEGVTLWEMGDGGPTNPQAEPAEGDYLNEDPYFSDDDRWLITTLNNGDLRLRRLKRESERTDDPNEQNLFDLRVAPGQRLPGPRFSTGSRWLFVDTGDVINAWSLRHPERKPLELRGREYEVLTAANDLVFSDDGRYAATMGADGVARIWWLENLQLTAQPQTFRIDDDSADHVLSPDSRWLLTRARNRPSLLWDMTDEHAWAHPITLTDGGGPSYGASDIGRLPFSPDGRWLITKSQSGDAQVWDLTTIKTRPRPFEIKLTRFLIAFSPDSRRLVAACADGVTRVWNLPLDDSHKPAVELPRRASPDLVILFGKSSRFLIAINREDCRLFDLTAAPTGWPQTGIQLATYGNLPSTATVSNYWTPPHTPVFSPDDRWLAMQNGWEVHLWDLRASPTSRPTLLYRDQARDATHGIGLEFSPKGGWLRTKLLRNETNLWRLTDAPTMTNVIPQVEWSKETFSPDDRWLMVNKGNKTTELWDLSETPRVARLPGWEEVPTPNQSAFSPDARWLMITKKSASKNAENDLLIWDLRDPAHTCRVMPETAFGYMMYRKNFSPDGRWFLTSKSVQGRWAEVALWDLRLKNPFEKAAFEPNAVGTFSPDGRWMAAPQGSGVALWDLSQLPSQTDPFILPSSQLNGSGGQELHMTFDAHHLYVFGSEVLRWDLDSERLRAQALEAAGRPLTGEERLRYLEDFDTNKRTAAHVSGDKPPDR